MLKRGSRGAAVVRAQKLLHHSRYGNFRPGKADGVFGLKTRMATRRAKYWLGYRLVRCTGQYGHELEGYLKGAPRPADYRARRNKRIARRRALLRRQFRHRAFTLALQQVGVHESPFGSNRQKYGEWYGENGVAWCAIFVSWCYSHAGRPLRYAFVPTIVLDARNNRSGLRATGSPRQGDLVCFDWQPDGQADHVGLFDRWVDQSRGIFDTVEGNTSDSNQSNGGMVMRRTRFAFEVAAFVHVVKA